MLKITIYDEMEMILYLVQSNEEGLDTVNEWKLRHPNYSTSSENEKETFTDLDNDNYAISYEPANKADVLAANIAKSGYANAGHLMEILNRFTDEEVDAIAYYCYRAAEKVGKDAFETEELYSEDEDEEVKMSDLLLKSSDFTPEELEDYEKGSNDFYSEGAVRVDEQ